MADTYDIGDKITLTAEFTDEGDPVDPTTVSCSVRAPSGVVTVPLTSMAVSGTYEAIVEPDEVGEWFYRFEGEGQYQAAEESLFVVRRRRVPEPTP